MPAFDSAQASASTGTVSDRVLLDALVVVAARRLVLGVDVAAAKFLSGQRVDDLVREQEILESMASTLKRAELQHPLRIEFFRDQIEANKVIQRSLYRYWSVHPEQFPVRCRHLTAELRPQLDLIDRHMLLILIRMKICHPCGAAISTPCLTGDSGQAQLCANSESFAGMRPTSRCARCTEPFVFLPPPILAA